MNQNYTFGDKQLKKMKRPVLNKNYIYVNGFWDGFLENTNGISFFVIENILNKTILKNSILTKDFNKANILLESVFQSSVISKKKWEYKIFFVAEPLNFKNDIWYQTLNLYNIVFCSSNVIKTLNVIDMPLFTYYIHSNFIWNRLIDKPVVTTPPPYFCCFIVSNPNCETINKMFAKLNTYKQVHSYGNYKNNMNYVIKSEYWSNQYINFISKYKFIICFENSNENTYITEKLINSYLANIIPIYWSNKCVKNIFNMNNMVFLEDETEDSFQKVIDKVIELDNDDEKYLNMVNQPVFTDQGKTHWENNYTIDAFALKMNKILLNKKIQLEYDMTNEEIIYNTNEEYRQKIRDIFYMDCSEIKESILTEDIDDVSLDELLYDENKINSEMEKMYELTKDHILFQNLYELAASKMFSIDRTIGQCVLFSYDYWYLFHKCLYVYFYYPDLFNETHPSYLHLLEKIK